MQFLQTLQAFPVSYTYNPIRTLSYLLMQGGLLIQI